MSKTDGGGFCGRCVGHLFAALQPACFDAGDIIYRRGECIVLYKYITLYEYLILNE